MLTRARPWRLMFGHHVPVVLLFIGFAVTAALMTSWLTALAVCAAAAAVVGVVLWSTYFTSADVFDDHLIVRNLFRSHFVKCDDLAEIARRDVWLFFTGSWSWSELTLRTRDGTMIPVLATLMMTKGQVARLIAAILASAGADAVTSEVDPRTFPRAVLAQRLERRPPGA